MLSLSFLCYSISEALFALSFSFLRERLMLLFVHSKAALAYYIYAGVTGLFYPPQTDFEHVCVWAALFCLRIFALGGHTNRHIQFREKVWKSLE